MAHPQNLTALALVLAAAVFAGLALTRLRMPSAAGFILIGMILGPTGFGLVERSNAIETLANLGVVLLLFLIGMELKLESFRRLMRLALGIVAAQIVATVGFTVILAQLTRDETTSAVVVGLVLAISSTALAVKMVEDAGEKQTPAGRLALAVLVAQDLAVVPLLLLINALAPNETTGALIGIAVRLVFGLAFLAGFVWLLTSIKSFRFPWSEEILEDFDVGTLTVLGICLGAATLSGLLGLSPALGAFLAGLAVGHSTLARAAQRMAQPIQSILLFAFFLSVGLLIDLAFVLRNLWLILITLAVVAIGKTFVNVAILRLFGQPGDVAFPAALFLAPVGEFSFVLATAGMTTGALTPEGHKLAIAVIALSLLVSPLWFIGARRAHMLAMKGITEAGILFEQTYARELFLVRLWSKRAAGFGAQAATAAAAVSSQAASRATDYYREREARRMTGSGSAGAREPGNIVADYEPHKDAFGDVPSPNVHPEAGVTRPSNDPS